MERCKEIFKTATYSKLLIGIQYIKGLFQGQKNITVSSLNGSVKWIGRFGGPFGRKSDGPPGLTTVWQAINCYVRQQLFMN
jgi:hypothetical protein